MVRVKKNTIAGTLSAIFLTSCTYSAVSNSNESLEIDYPEDFDAVIDVPVECALAFHKSFKTTEDGLNKAGIDLQANLLGDPALMGKCLLSEDEVVVWFYPMDPAVINDGSTFVFDRDTLDFKSRSR